MKRVKNRKRESVKPIFEPREIMIELRRKKELHDWKNKSREKERREKERREKERREKERERREREKERERENEREIMRMNGLTIALTE